MNRIINNDHVRIRELGDRMDSASIKLEDHIDSLRKGLNALMGHCTDRKMDEFKIQFTDSSRTISEMKVFLVDTSKYLKGIAEESDGI